MSFSSLSAASREHLGQLLFARKESSITFAQILARSPRGVIYLRKVPVKFRKWDRIIAKKSKQQDWSSDQGTALLEAILEHEQNNICPLSFPIKTKFDAILNFIYSVAFGDLVNYPHDLDPRDLQGLEKSIVHELIHEILGFLEARRLETDPKYAWFEPKLIYDFRELQKKCLEKERF